MFKRNAKSCMCLLFIFLLLVSTSDEHCLLSNKLCNRKVRKFEFNKGKIPESGVFTMRNPVSSSRYLKYVKPAVFVFSNVKSRNNLTNTSVPLPRKNNLDLKDVELTLLSSRSTIDSEDTSEKSEEEDSKIYSESIKAKIKPRFDAKSLALSSKKLEQIAKHKKRLKIEFDEQLDNSPTQNKALKNHLRKSTSKRVTKTPIVLKLMHNKSALSKRKSNMYKLRERFRFGANNSDFNSPWYKNSKLLNVESRHLRSTASKTQLLNTSNELTRSFLKDVSNQELELENLSSNKTKNSPKQFLELEKNNTINVTSSEVTDIQSHEGPVKDNTVMNIVPLSTNTPMKSFWPFETDSSSALPQKTSDVEPMKPKEENSYNNRTHPKNHKIKRHRSNKHKLKQRHLKTIPGEEESNIDYPAARIWYESDQKDYLQSKVNIKLPKEEYKNASPLREYGSLSSQPIKPFLKNLKNSGSFKSKHIHHTFYQPELGKQPNLLNGTTQQDIRKLLMFLRNVIHSSKAETSKESSLSHPIETYDVHHPPAVNTEGRVHYPSEYSANKIGWHDVFSHFPKVNPTQATESVTNDSNYITIGYRRNVEIIVSPVKPKGIFYYVMILAGFVGVVFVLTVTITAVIIVLKKLECESKLEFPVCDFFKSRSKSEKLPSAVPEKLLKEDNDDAESWDLLEENRRLKLLLNRTLGEMVFCSDSYLEECCSKEQHSKKLQNAAHGIIK